MQKPSKRLWVILAASVVVALLALAAFVAYGLATGAFSYEDSTVEIELIAPS